MLWIIFILLYKVLWLPLLFLPLLEAISSYIEPCRESVWSVTLRTYKFKGKDIDYCETCFSRHVPLWGEIVLIREYLQNCALEYEGKEGKRCLVPWYITIDKCTALMPSEGKNVTSQPFVLLRAFATQILPVLESSARLLPQQGHNLYAVSSPGISSLLRLLGRRRGAAFPLDESRVSHKTGGLRLLAALDLQSQRHLCVPQCVYYFICLC